ncbi:F20N2.16 [Arabidopsis thaliana]|uniref:F20N2.16 n=1 Tax=Arabidopsis thaliana TaxID=3702 RepID=Q9LFZ5_ARATH|nr:F20N2.16 [Arabidopsis thaliana]
MFLFKNLYSVKLVSCKTRNLYSFFLQQRIVLKMDMSDEKSMKKAMKIASAKPGVRSVSIQGQNDQLVLLGEGIDLAELTRELKKKVCMTTIITVQAAPPQQPPQPHPMGQYNQMPPARRCTCEIPNSAGVLFLCIVLISFVTGNANSGMISDLCKHSDDPNLCLSSITSRPESGEFAGTSNQIEIIAISAASANASATSSYIKQKLSNEDLEPAIEDTLEDCQKDYQDAVEQLDDSISAMLADAHTDVDVWLSAAISAIESCGSALGSRAGNDAELSQRNEVFLKLCKNALMINKMLT